MSDVKEARPQAGNVNAQMTGGEALVKRLLANKVESLFLVPGIQLDWVVDALAREPAIKTYVPRHEQSVSYMADGYARVTGKHGVGMVVPGPGLLNAGAGLSTAYACNSPVVMLAGHIHSQAVDQGFGNLHELKSQTQVLDALTKWSAIVKTRQSLEPIIDEAFVRATSGRPRPVGLELPYDMLIAKGEASQKAAYTPEPAPWADEKLVLKACALIDEAARPVLYVGGGAHGAADEIRALAEKLGAPVVSSDNGRGVLPDAHPLSFTSLGGRAIFDVADVVVVIGSRFMDVMTPEPSWSGDDKRYVFINIDAADARAPRDVTVFLHSDAKTAVSDIFATVGNRSVQWGRFEALKVWQETKIAETGVLYDYVKALRAALPDNGIFVNELTQVGYLARVAFEVRAPRSFISPGYQGALGYSFPTGLGAAVGGKGKRVFSISGDGGFGWSMQELATARKYQLPVTLIVFNDGYYGNVRGIQRRTFGREYAVDLQNPDFATLAKAFDVPFARALNPSELEGILRETVQTDGPVMVEVPVGEMPSPWPLLRLKPMEGAGGGDVPKGLL